jgi:tetratricopeptide (TPR) repeat protein
MKRRFAFLISMVLVVAGMLLGQATPVGPLTEKEVIDGLKSKNYEGVTAAVKQRGVAFEVDAQAEKKLRKAKADDALIELIRKSTPSERAKLSSAGGPSAEEAKAFVTLRQELDPDKTIQEATEFEQKYPDSQLLSYAYWLEAIAYQRKGNVEKIVDYGEKSLKLKPDNLNSLLLLAAIIPQPQYLKLRQADEDKLLGEAEGYAQKALQMVDQVPRQPNQTDEQYKKEKDSIASTAHASLGMIHLERSQLALTGPDRDELSKAVEEFKTCVAQAEHPAAEDYYRMGEAYSMLGNLDGAIDAFTKASELAQGSVVKTFADQRLADLRKRKAQQPATPPKQ